MPSDTRQVIRHGVHHKAAVTEGGDEGATRWARACSTDREAIVLLKSEDAETLLQNGDRYRRPPQSAPRPWTAI